MFHMSTSYPPDYQLSDVGWNINRVGSYFGVFVSAFAMTLGIEVPLLCLIMRKRASMTRIIVTGIVANACTLPFVWFVFPMWLEGFGYVLVSEVYAVVVEFLFIKSVLRVDSGSAILGSFLMNLSSFLVGLIVFG